jgi:hypothetical protein
MTALFAIITFFFIFVVVYLATAVVLAVVAWWLKRRAKLKGAVEGIHRVEQQMDRVKEKAFLIALVLTFFIITPFVVITVFVMP